MGLDSRRGLLCDRVGWYGSTLTRRLRHAPSSHPLVNRPALVVAHAAAASCTHWAAPSGSGSSCTDSSPCTFSTWYGSKAGPGSVLCLKYGTYKGDTHILAFSAKSGSSSQLLTVRPFWFLGLRSGSCTPGAVPYDCLSLPDLSGSCPPYPYASVLTVPAAPLTEHRRLILCGMIWCRRIPGRRGGRPMRTMTRLQSDPLAPLLRPRRPPYCAWWSACAG